MSVPAVSAHAETPTDHTDRRKAIGDALTITRRELRAAPPETALKAALVAASLRLTAAQTIAHLECVIQEDETRCESRHTPAWNTPVRAGGVR